VIPDEIHDEPVYARLRRVPRELERRTLWEQDGVLVMDKPWGIPSTGKTLDDPDSLQSALMHTLGCKVWAVHQLDADTSGINLFVTEKALVPRWKQRMRFPNGAKTYLAVVHGLVEFELRRVDAPIGVVQEAPARVLGVHADGQRAVSMIRRVALGRACSLLEVQIETGRTHQIRIHLASLGHPLLGEEWYCKPPSAGHIRQALHAWRMEFHDGQRPRGFQCPLPEDFEPLFRQHQMPPPAMDGPPSTTMAGDRADPRAT